MKKVRITGICLLIIVLLLAAGCKAKHTCVFDVENTAADYLASEANCTQKAAYYYTCSCGKVGTETFFAGEVKHAPGEEVMWKRPTCDEEGEYRINCTLCDEMLESKPIPTTEHFFRFGVCGTCYAVNMEEKDGIADLGIATIPNYGQNAYANDAWDLAIRDGILYRGGGDYSANTGPTTIWALNLATNRWFPSGVAQDEAVHRFVDLNGVITAMGTDATESWAYGNFYQLKDGKWEKFRTIDGGVHVYDMAAFEGKLFAGIGTDKGWYPLSVSTDGGKTFASVPFYKDGEQIHISDYDYSRIYELLVCNNKLYAVTTLVRGGSSHYLFRYNEGKMEYVRDAYAFFSIGGASYNYINGEFDLNGVSYFGGSRGLFGVTDFSKSNGFWKIAMPNDEIVADCLLDNGTAYVLCYKYNGSTAKTYKTVIYKSTTMENGSFEVVKSFDYPVCALSFVKDGEFLYTSMGSRGQSEKNGTVLRIRIPK